MEFDEVIEALEMLKEEVGIPKGLKIKFDEIIAILNNEQEAKEIRSHKVGAILEDISSDSSLQSFIRTQIYQIMSLL